MVHSSSDSERQIIFFYIEFYDLLHLSIVKIWKEAVSKLTLISELNLACFYYKELGFLVWLIQCRELGISKGLVKIH